MAVDDITSDVRLSGGGTLTDSANVLTQIANFGGAILPTIFSRYSFGTGNAQANKWYLAKRTLAATTYDDLDLTSGLTAAGATQAFTALKQVLIAIISPDGTKKLRVGPQGRTHANQLWFQAATANFWEETYTHIWKDRPITGWALSAGSTDVLSVYNPGGSSLDYAIFLLGTG